MLSVDGVIILFLRCHMKQECNIVFFFKMFLSLLQLCLEYYSYSFAFSYNDNLYFSRIKSVKWEHLDWKTNFSDLFSADLIVPRNLIPEILKYPIENKPVVGKMSFWKVTELVLKLFKLSYRENYLKKIESILIYNWKKCIIE